jgi:hypothetical protein
MAIAFACSVLIAFTGGIASGQELQDIASVPSASTAEMVTTKLQVKIASTDHLILYSLLNGINENDSVEDASQKIDRIRTKLYPNSEMRVEIKPLKTGDQAVATINLEKKIVWYNTVTNAGNYWVAANILSGAACCVVKVTKGKYSHYYEMPDRTWKFGGATLAGGVWTATTYGSDLYRGFKGIGRYASNKADIVMYFYYVD